MLSVHAVAGILQRDNKILVSERPAGKPYSGYWEFPGGKIEANESGEQALIRELQEELGIVVNAAEFLLHHEYTYPDKMVYLQLWRVTQFLGKPRSQENQRLRWVTMTEIMSMKLLEGNWAIVDKIK